MLREPVEDIFDRRARLDRVDRIEKEDDCCVSRRELDRAGKGRIFQTALCRKDSVQRFIRRAFKIFTDANDQRGVSERYNLHQPVIRPFRARTFDLDFDRIALAALLPWLNVKSELVQK